MNDEGKQARAALPYSLAMVATLRFEALRHLTGGKHNPMAAIVEAETTQWLNACRDEAPEVLSAFEQVYQHLFTLNAGERVMLCPIKAEGYDQ